MAETLRGTGEGLGLARRGAEADPFDVASRLVCRTSGASTDCLSVTAAETAVVLGLVRCAS
jgi:hypothetical protein